MRESMLRSWDELETWAGTWGNEGRYIFRGQADSEWTLQTSLARLFWAAQGVDVHHWRRRELKMYRTFRERLLRLCPGLYDNWEPQGILSLMQHHGVPTRILDFTFSPLVAAFFALRDTRGDSAIWVVDTERLARTREAERFPEYSGPTHVGGYQHAEKHERISVLIPESRHPRLAAQRGCFLLPGHISRAVGDAVHAECVTLSEAMVFDALAGLRGKHISEETLVPDFDALAADVRRFATTGSSDYPEA